jgi:hypothetical protein
LQVAEQRTGGAVELLVELLYGCLLEHAFAAGLAFGAAQDDSPVPRSFLDPIQRVHEIPGAVEADVQGIGDTGVIRGSGSRRSASTRTGWSRCLVLVAVDDLDLLAAGQPHAMTGVMASVGFHA